MYLDTPLTQFNTRYSHNNPITHVSGFSWSKVTDVSGITLPLVLRAYSVVSQNVVYIGLYEGRGLIKDIYINRPYGSQNKPQLSTYNTYNMSKKLKRNNNEHVIK